jgi:ATP-dependent DNA helicase RecG
MFDLSTRDVKYLPGVGPQRAAMLNKELNIYSLRDLLYYFPYKYVDRSRLYYIHEIDGNMPYIQLRGRILSFEVFGEGRQRRLVGHFSDGTGVVNLIKALIHINIPKKLQEQKALKQNLESQIIKQLKQMSQKH